VEDLQYRPDPQPFVFPSRVGEEDSRQRQRLFAEQQPHIGTTEHRGCSSQQALMTLMVLEEQCFAFMAVSL